LTNDHTSPSAVSQMAGRRFKIAWQVPAVYAQALAT
jgi:hypothetical protein